MKLLYSCWNSIYSTEKYLVITSPAGAVANYCDEYVCVSVHLSVSEDISRTTHNLCQIFVYMLPLAMAQSFSGIVAICYVLPVLWMTSCFFSIMGQIAV